MGTKKKISSLSLFNLALQACLDMQTKTGESEKNIIIN
jgi:hypothetical protein